MWRQRWIHLVYWRFRCSVTAPLDHKCSPEKRKDQNTSVGTLLTSATYWLGKSERIGFVHEWSTIRKKINYPEKSLYKQFTLVGTNVFVEAEPLALISAGLQYETCQWRRRSLGRQPLQKQALISLIGCQEEGRLQDWQSGDRCRFLCWHSWERHVQMSDILCSSQRCRPHERPLVQTLSSHRHDFTERPRAEFVLRQHAELVASAGEQPGYQQVVFGSGHR